jgi:hypothetical protein
MPPLAIADTVQTFVDDYVIADMQGLERRFHGAEKHDGPVIAKSVDTETRTFFPIRVLKVDDGPCRIWYGCHADSGRQSVHTAVSDDGVHWEKPAVQPDGSNRAVFADGRIVDDTGCAVFYEPDAEPARRYKLVHYKPSYYLAHSPDGIVWTPHSDQPVWENGAGDGLEECFFFLKDDRSGKYRGYMRVWQERHTIRRLALGESDDLTSWTGPEIIWSAPPEYGIGAQVYGMTVHQEDGIYWGFPWMYYASEPPDPRDQQTIKLKLAFSRDGIDWQPVFPDQDVVPLGEPGSFDGEMICTSCPVLAIGDERRIYYSGHGIKHNDDGGKLPGGIGMATFRRHGFVSLHADDGGVLLTKRFHFKGDELRLNAKTANDGAIVAELLADNGDTLSGYQCADSDAFTGDAVDAPLSWRGSSDLSSLTGQYVMLRLRLRNAELFTFRVAGRPDLFVGDCGPPPVRCGWCRQAPVIDGVLDDLAWQDFGNSGVAEGFVTFGHLETSPVQTRAMFTRDATHLYISVDCEEPNLAELVSNREENEADFFFDSDDTVEFRLSAPGQGTFFNQLCVNAAGKRLQSWFSVEEGGSHMVPDVQWQAAVSRGAGHWYIEMAVPFTALNTPAPAAGERWQLHVIRHRQPDGYTISSWSCLFGAVHRNDLAGALVF